MPGLPHPLRAQLERKLGRVASASPCPSTQGRVWRVVLRDRVLAVKTGRDREAHTLRRLAELPVPRLEAELPGPPPALAMAWIDGAPVGDDPRLHEQAGAALRRIHSVAVHDEDPMSVEAALAARLAAWCERARGKVPARWIDGVRSGVDPSAFSECVRVTCHRDYTPSNWLATPDGMLVVIDFGQARLDLALWDFVKLAGGLWRDRPDLAAPFLSGYGSRLDARVSPLVALHGLQTVVWGLDHADPTFVAQGRRILAAELG